MKAHPTTLAEQGAVLKAKALPHGLARTELHVLLTLRLWADYTDGTSIFPALSTVAGVAVLADRGTVRRHVRKLEAKGWLICEKRAKGGGHGSTGRYRLAVPEPLWRQWEQREQDDDDLWPPF